MLAENLVNDGLISSCAIASLDIPHRMSETNRIKAAGVGDRRIGVPGFSGTYISMRAFCNPELDFLNALIFWAMQSNVLRMATFH